MPRSYYVVRVYRKDGDVMCAQIEYNDTQMQQYEDCCKGLDLATDFYYDVEVVRV